jgi:hypothetical protein
MRINGEWFICDDGVVRPVIVGELQNADGSHVKTPLLVDTGADCTVFSSRILSLLDILPIESQAQLGGIGGGAESVALETHLQLLDDNGQPVLFHGTFAAFTSAEAADMSVLGRDILGLFAVIVDQPGDVVSLIGQRYRYVIEQQ